MYEGIDVLVRKCSHNYHAFEVQKSRHSIAERRASSWITLYGLDVGAGNEVGVGYLSAPEPTIPIITIQ